MSKKKGKLRVRGFEFEYDGPDPDGAALAVLAAIAPNEMPPVHHAFVYMDCADALPDDAVTTIASEVTCSTCKVLLPDDATAERNAKRDPNSRLEREDDDE